MLLIPDRIYNWTLKYERYRNIVIFLLFCLFLIPQIALSAVTEDYAPLIGAKLQLSYSVGDTYFDDTITFEASTYESNGEIYLDGTSSLYGAGFSFFENTYVLVFPFVSNNTAYIGYYDISVSENSVTGVHYWLDTNWNPVYGPFNTTGTKTFIELKADFDACPPVGEAPLTVQFTDKSQGPAATWQWDFGDGTTSTEQNPSHVYSDAGTYTVTLTVSNANDSDTITRPDYIDVGVTAPSYRFERMWPSLQQPWYFAFVRRLARDRDGNIYLVNAGRNRVVKMTADGQFISNFGEGGGEDGQFRKPYGVAVDGQGNVYVTDLGQKSDNSYDEAAYRVQKFNSSGQLVGVWREVTGPTDLLVKPTGISVDNDGNILVADSGNLRIVKYSPEGAFIDQLDGYEASSFTWPTDVKADAQGNIFVVDEYGYKVHKFTTFAKESYDRFYDAADTGTTFYAPTAIDIDNEGNLYVTDYTYHGNNRVVKLAAADGQATVLIDNGLGFGEQQFWGPFGIAVDPAGYLYVGAYWGGSVSKFTLSGEFINKWSSASDRIGFFAHPHALAVDPVGNIYVADSANYRIQRIDAVDGSITYWGSKGSGDGQFEGDPDAHQGPHAIKVHPNGDIYVADTLNNRIQVFDSTGAYLDQIGDLTYPSGLAIDPDGNIYVAEWSGSHQIKKFDSAHNQIGVWGGYGSSDGKFYNPHGIAIDADGLVYVADANNNRIQMFDADGNFVDNWGVFGYEDGQLNQPWDVAIDEDNNVLVADTYNNRIQKFTRYGCFLERLGRGGSLPGLFYQPQNLALGPDNSLFVLETLNNRVQKFKKALPDLSKAIIVAGGGDSADNRIWDATRVNAYFAFLTLTYQGFTKETIHYLSPETGVDLDDNGLADDVDGDATIANLQDAITNWAADATNLILYIVDHGGDGTFNINGEEQLAVEDLNNWLNTLQSVIPGKVVVVYDACKSGSFLPSLIPTPGKERVVVASSLATESAKFASRGAISFSNYFWSRIYKGENLFAAFDAAGEAIRTAVGNQHPLLDDDGSGTGNDAGDGILALATLIGNGTLIQDEAPQIGSVEALQIDNSASVQLRAVNVTDAGGIARVWAIITPPGYTSAPSENTIQDLPYCDLKSTATADFEAICENFYFPGTYQLDFYAMDKIGNTSAPIRTSVTITDPPSRKAILVAGGGDSDPNWPAIERNAGLAYNALRFQGYPDENIHYLSSASSDAGVDAPATLNDLENAVNIWAADNAHDLVVYLVGNGGPGFFRVKADETVSAADLDTWFDGLQVVIPGSIIFIYDGPGSGSFIPNLLAPAGKERILITSSLSSQGAAFSADGDISFSRFFWERVFKGVNVRDAFTYARTAIEGGVQNQSPQLEDNGDGIPNQAGDGKIALSHTIGMGIKLSGYDPQGGATVDDLTLTGETSADIWIDNVSASNAVDKVYAVITPPGSIPAVSGLPQPDPSTLELIDDGTGLYSGTYDGFVTYGSYGVSIFVKDVLGNVSVPKKTTVFQSAGPDVFEEDDSYDQARVIIVNSGSPQRHNFYDHSDQDWVMFYGTAGETYDLVTKDIGATSQTEITLYASDGITVIDTIGNDTYTEGDIQTLLQCPDDGIYYVKVGQAEAGTYGLNTEYDLWVDHPVGADTGTLIGKVMDYFGTGISGAIITAVADTLNFTGISLPNGYYMMVVPTGTYSLTASALDYPVVSRADVTVQTESHVAEDFTLSHLNTAPVLNAIGNKAVGQEVELSFVVTAVDTDVPANTLTYTLDDGAPAGAIISSDGIFSWTPTILQGPDVFAITVRVTDDGTPVLDDSETFEITVFAAVKGDINGGGLDLADLMIALKALSGEDVSQLIRSDYALSGADVNGDGRVGPEEAVYILQAIAELRQ